MVRLPAAEAPGNFGRIVEDRGDTFFEIFQDNERTAKTAQAAFPDPSQAEGLGYGHGFGFAFAARSGKEYHGPVDIEYGDGPEEKLSGKLIKVENAGYGYSYILQSFQVENFKPGLKTHLL